MYLAMNRFQVTKGREADFEAVWKSRDSKLEQVPGFVEFRLMKGAEQEDHTLYATHTFWTNYQAFEAWTKSDHFRDAHKNAGNHDGLYLGHPNFEGFQTVQELAVRPLEAVSA